MGHKTRKRHKLPAWGRKLLVLLSESFPVAMPYLRPIVSQGVRDLDLGQVSEDKEAWLDDLMAKVGEKLKSETLDLGETTPFVPANQRAQQALAHLRELIDGHLCRQILLSQLRAEDKRWMYRGILLTRAVDNRLKKLFLTGEIEYKKRGFQGKGFRSLGQEAIYAAGLRLKRGASFYQNGRWTGDVVAPLIRDLGIALAFADDDPLIALNAQAAKDGPPLYGRDLHIGDMNRGILPAAAPLAISSTTATGCALAMQLREEQRVALSFIGEGGSSLGEWHEAINLGSSRRLPIIYCVQNNQRALSTPVSAQSAVRTFADKAVGYGIHGLSIDGTDPEAIAVAFAWAAQRARDGKGATLIETISMRMCGHAHHDDMLYLGSDPTLNFELPQITPGGYVDAQAYRAWATRDPVVRYGQKLTHENILSAEDIQELREQVLESVEETVQNIKSMPWPKPESVGTRVYVGQTRVEKRPSPGAPHKANLGPLAAPLLEQAPPLNAGGSTFIEAIGRGLDDVLNAIPEAFIFGEDVGPPYGNAFMLLRPLLSKHGSRMLNAPLAENAIIGAAVGAAIEGMCPLVEMQFNDFVASGFNQVVNNAAKLYYRTGLECPMVIRMPWGGLRSAGPYHSQDTSPWFYRSPGLKIVAPSTPHDARGLLMAAALDRGPVLFYEHIALYRNPSIKQTLAEESCLVEIGKAAFRQLGHDLTILTYGAYAHRVNEKVEFLRQTQGIECDLIDLRTLMPIDWDAISASLRRTHKVLLVGEDSRSGSILESIAATIADDLFEYLDAPVRILASLDTPVPYAPSLEEVFLPSQNDIEAAILQLHAW
jgi:2-oxoisovalerate dehydrogenase E1 component